MVRILGISCYYHEAAAALLVDGKIVAATAEERFSRIKHDASFPEQAIEFCLKYGKIKPRDLDWVVFYEKPFRKFERNLTVSLENFPSSLSFFVEAMKNFLTEKLWIKSKIAAQLEVSPEKILFVPHHLSHAAASFYPSPFKEAAYLTLDGVGEWTTGSWGICINNKIRPLGEMRFPDSVGLLYSTFTAYLGFEINDGEYTVMGMAGYGQPKYIKLIKKLYKQHKDGSIELNLPYFTFHKSSQLMYSKKFARLFDGLDRFNIASSLQTEVETMIFRVLNFIHQQTGMNRLIFGGGVALNSVLNGKITANSGFKGIFIFPAAGDDGGCVGAALYVYHHILGYKKRYLLFDVFLGAGLGKLGGLGKKMSKKHLINYVAGKLADGKVVGWCEGRAEFGPRALGHRSILADPRNPQMKDLLNQKIKFREQFRPFAPAVLSEYARDYFLGDQESLDNLGKYMLGTFRVKSQARKKIASIVHVDGTARAQLVAKDYPGKLRSLLEAFYQKTKIPVLLNTSFNLKGEPIVNSPEDALNTFQRSGLDILVLENYIMEK